MWRMRLLLDVVVRDGEWTIVTSLRAHWSLSVVLAVPSIGAPR